MHDFNPLAEHYSVVRVRTASSPGEASTRYESKGFTCKQGKREAPMQPSSGTHYENCTLD
jgi:hypothetical protein